MSATPSSTVLSPELVPMVSGSEEFSRQVQAAMMPLQVSLRALHGELGKPKNTVAMQRQLGVGNTICWQISRIIHAESLVNEARHAPFPQAMAPLLEAAERIGVRPKTLTAVREAAEGFRVFMKEHASDQATFDTLIAGVSGDEGEEKIQLRHRRAAYRAESHIWGLQRDLSAVTVLCRKSADGQTCDTAVLQSQFGYRRLRANASATAFAFGDITQWGSMISPLDAGAMEKYGSPLVPIFCSYPIPPLEMVALKTGSVVFKLADGSLGRGGSKDLTTGILMRGDSPTIVDGRRKYGLDCVFFCPTGRFIFNLVIDRSEFPNFTPAVTTRLHNFGADDPRGEPLPLKEHMTPLGPADRLPPCPVLPNSNAIIQYAARATQSDLSRFDCYQLVMDYPIFASNIGVTFPME